MVAIMGTPRTPLHRLVVVRHAKSDRSAAVPDHDRPLDDRGRREAPLLGAWLDGSGLRPDLVLVSTAVRAATTWELAAAALTDPPPSRADERLYGAGTRALLAVLAEVPDDVHTLLTVGHEPTASDVVDLLASDDSDPDALDGFGGGFRTCCAAVLETELGWAALAAGPEGSARLTAFAVPR